MATRSSPDEFDINIVKDTEITQEQLDRKIEEEKLYEIAGHLGNYELYAGEPGFKLSNATKADLKDYALKNGNQYAMCEALKEWRNETDVFTYRALLVILKKLKKGRIAEAVCKICELQIQ